MNNVKYYTTCYYLLFCYCTTYFIYRYSFQKIMFQNCICVCFFFSLGSQEITYTSSIWNNNSFSKLTHKILLSFIFYKRVTNIFIRLHVQWADLGWITWNVLFDRVWVLVDLCSWYLWRPPVCLPHARTFRTKRTFVGCIHWRAERPAGQAEVWVVTAVQLEHNCYQIYINTANLSAWHPTTWEQDLVLSLKES